ncbi:MAG: di-trans,poly-cis-decaprenylcistransferase [Acidimicrobiia bacterium]|nr:di-trans,poly-cis-decaprenylcistransferase [Acidimicrobiia bacterium]MYC57405.1 di-trans,poly-cis-decaprenylcistransferase [Acidimicrobiia bacterium]MYG94602.1 di-trans,poly-cis-decaprenylcistransferase [Acidimicrobiia bacterium]MYI30243.1 di-trans,poly-cis-decaprenylcistransferase [Acidimicrobiia bacterium]
MPTDSVDPGYLDMDRIPRHVGCVMDGNGRWAEQRGMARTEGHARGEHALFDVIEGALELGIEWLSVYAFSTENWNRPEDEVRFLMNFNRNILRSRCEELNQMGVRIRFVGRRDWRVPKGVVQEMDEAIELTRCNKRLTLVVAFNYGGRAEIVDAVRKIAEQQIPASRITERTIARHLYDQEMPEPDLIIRTSGEYRISNFLLWELAYSELVFTDVLWPDFDRRDLFAAIAQYQDRHRRFGQVQ